MRTDVGFRTEDGVILRGWHYRPDAGGGPWPTIVMAHGYSAVKEMYLDRFAEVFSSAGLAAIVFDNRNFGASDGEPRQEIDPWQQIADYRDAISFAQTLPETDAARIGVWGSSYSGAHVIVLGATDRRIRCVASQVPLISGHRNARRLIRADLVPAVEAMCAEDRLKRYRGEPPGMIPVVSPDPAGPAVLPTPDSWAWFDETGRTRAQAWRNEVTLRSVELFLAYEPGAYIEYVSPTPLLLVVALGDHLTVADEALAAYGRAPPQEARHPQGRALRRLRRRFRQCERCRPRLVRRESGRLNRRGSKRRCPPTLVRRKAEQYRPDKVANACRGACATRDERGRSAPYNTDSLV